MDDQQWTPATLYRHFTQLMDAQERAISIAEANAAQWRNNANEWRAAMSDRERAFMPRGELDTRFRNVEAQIADLKATVNRSAGKSSGLSAGWGYLVGAIGLIILVVEFLSRNL